MIVVDSHFHTSVETQARRPAEQCMYSLRDEAKTSDAKETQDKLTKLIFAAKECENKLDEYVMFGTTPL